MSEIFLLYDKLTCLRKCVLKFWESFWLASTWTNVLKSEKNILFRLGFPANSSASSVSGVFIHHTTLTLFVCSHCAHIQVVLQGRLAYINYTNYRSFAGWQDSSVVECLPKNWKVRGSNLCHGMLLWRWALHLHLAPAAHISIMLLRPVE